MMHFFPNTFKDNIAQVPAVIDDKLWKPFMEVVHGFAVIAGGMAATSCRIASFNCSIVPGRRTSPCLKNKLHHMCFLQITEFFVYLVLFDFYRPSKCGSYFCRTL